MKIVIDIPEELISEMGDENYQDVISWFDTTLYCAIKDGTPLPKGHGRLKDVDWIDDNCPNYRTEDGAWCYKWEDIDNAPTIIEEDIESEDKE